MKRYIITLVRGSHFEKGFVKKTFSFFFNGTCQILKSGCETDLKPVVLKIHLGGAWGSSLDRQVFEVIKHPLYTNYQ